MSICFYVKHVFQQIINNGNKYLEFACCSDISIFIRIKISIAYLYCTNLDMPRAEYSSIFLACDSKKVCMKLAYSRE